MNHGLVYDPLGDRLIVIGGHAGSGAQYLNDVHELPLSGPQAYEWHTLSPSGPPPTPRMIFGSQYDPVRERVLFYGGETALGLSNEVWALSLGASPSWSMVAASGSGPGVLKAHTMVYDPAADRMVVFGGYAGSPLNAAYALSLSGSTAWTALSTTGGPPGGRFLISGIHDPVAGRMIVHGGMANGAWSDTWALQWDTPSVGVPDGDQRGRLELLGARPNPSRGEGLNVAFSLSRRGEARLDLIDIAGRRLATRDLGTLEPGAHRIALSQGRRLEPGLYVIRLAAEGRVFTSKALVVR
jgi:hypothetical protein